MTIFPEFTNLSLDDKAEVEKIISSFEPYSDFNFVSLFCWNTDGTTQVSLLNDNLVIRLPDYITAKPIYSILGGNSIATSVEEVLRLTPELNLVPEAVTRELAGEQALAITEEPHQFDYIYSVDNLVNLPGQHYRSQRKNIYRFMRQYGDTSRLAALDFNDAATRQRILDTFTLWSQERDRQADDVHNEQVAVSRLLENHSSFNLVGVELFIGDKPVGFSINEVLSPDYGICHFHKSILSYRGIDPYLTRESVRTLQDSGCKWVNWEQDLGIPGLHQLKTEYQPIKMLKKYSVSKQP